MDIKLLIQPFFEHAAALLAGPNLVAATAARIVTAVLKEVGFDLDKAAEALAKLGFKVSRDLVSEAIEAAKTGVKTLRDWFVSKLATSVEVNEATSQVLVNQAEPIAAAVQEALPDEKDQIAETMKEGLQKYGGATAEIASLYADVIKDLSNLNKLVGEMEQKLMDFGSQSVTAKEKSLIKDIKQTYVGDQPIDQLVDAGKESAIEGVIQEQRIGGAGASQVISAGSRED